MWILVLIAAVVSEGGRGIDHIEFSSKERCIAAQKFSYQRETIKDAYCVQK